MIGIGQGGGIVSTLVDVYVLVIFVYVLASWVPESRYQGWYRTLGTICEPYLGLFRKIIPPLGMVDISPMIAIFVLAIFSSILKSAGL